MTETTEADLRERVRNALGALGARRDDRIGVAVSGGADSVALLHLLRDHILHVLHVDHALRSGSAQDARFVEGLADELGLPCTVSRARVDGGSSVEAAARYARYAALSEAAARAGLRWVATGHTRDDQAETVLLRALRGAGVSGLAGVAPRRGIFVRPLLGVGRGELRAWLRAAGHRWIEDPTNEDLAFERNWVRHVLMPQLAGRRPGVDRTLARLADHARSDEAALDDLARAVVARAESDDLGILLREADLAPLARAVASRAVRIVLWRLGVDPSAADVDRALTLMVASRGRCRCGDVTLYRLPEGLGFVREPVEGPEPVELPRSGELVAGAWGLRLRVGSPAAGAWRWRAVLPNDPSAPRVLLRSRRPGDRVPTPRGTRKLQDVLVDAKVPRMVREHVPVLAGPDGPLAVVGLTVGARRAGYVVDAQPWEPTWSRALWWTRAS